MTNCPTIRIEHELEDVHIHEGETLTVWLCAGDDRGHVQVELRVLDNGSRQVFMDRVSHVEMYTFKDWESADRWQSEEPKE